jgi:hypothetical protein
MCQTLNIFQAVFGDDEEQDEKGLSSGELSARSGDRGASGSVGSAEEVNVSMPQEGSSPSKVVEKVVGDIGEY